MRSVKFTVLLIVSLAVQRFIRTPRKSHDCNMRIVSRFLEEASCIFLRQGIPSWSFWSELAFGASAPELRWNDLSGHS
jgi:hypothetical protein